MYAFVFLCYVTYSQRHDEEEAQNNANTIKTTHKAIRQQLLRRRRMSGVVHAMNHTVLHNISIMPSYDVRVYSVNIPRKGVRYCMIYSTYYKFWG